MLNIPGYDWDIRDRRRVSIRPTSRGEVGVESVRGVGALTWKVSACTFLTKKVGLAPHSLAAPFGGLGGRERSTRSTRGRAEMWRPGRYETHSLLDLSTGQHEKQRVPARAFTTLDLPT